MSSQYRICHNCGASLAPGETHCPRCGVPYVEHIIQKPGEFEPFPPDQANASGQTEPYEIQPQQPVVLPPPQQQAPYPPQVRGMCSHLHQHHMVQVVIISKRQVRLEDHLRPLSLIPGKG